MGIKNIITLFSVMALLSTGLHAQEPPAQEAVETAIEENVMDVAMDGSSPESWEQSLANIEEKADAKQRKKVSRFLGMPPRNRRVVGQLNVP